MKILIFLMFISIRSLAQDFPVMAGNLAALDVTNKTLTVTNATHRLTFTITDKTQFRRQVMHSSSLAEGILGEHCLVAYDQATTNALTVNFQWSKKQ